MELRQLRQFMAVAETNSFRAAAERLHMAQPPLSVAIRKLEEEAGVLLFERGPRGTVPTAAGRLAYEAAGQALARIDDVIVAARQGASGARGRLRVGFIGSVTFELLPSLVRAFRARFPDVRLELGESTNAELLAAVASRAIDVAFVRLPAIRAPAIEFVTVQDDVFCLALPTSHPLCGRARPTLRDVASEPFVGYAPSRAGGLQAGMARLFEHAGITPSIVQEAVQVQTVLGLVGSGIGLALVPSANVRYFPSSVRFRPLFGVPKALGIGIAVAHRTAIDNPATTRFVETIVELRASLRVERVERVATTGAGESGEARLPARATRPAASREGNAAGRSRRATNE